MTQIIVTLDGNKTAVNNTIQSTTSSVSPGIRKLRGIAKGITKEQIEEDDRLAYIMNK